MANWTTNLWHEATSGGEPAVRSSRVRNSRNTWVTIYNRDLNTDIYLIKNTLFILVVNSDKTLESLLKILESLLRDLRGEVLLEGCEEDLLALVAS